MSATRPDTFSLALEFGARVLIAVLAFSYFLGIPADTYAVSVPAVVGGLVAYLVGQSLLFGRRLFGRPALWPALLAALADFGAAFGVLVADPAPLPPMLLLLLLAALNAALRQRAAAVAAALAGASLALGGALFVRETLYGEALPFATGWALALLLACVAYAGALGLRQAALAARASRFLDQDPETLLMNRRGFDNAARYLVPLHHRTQLPLVVMIAGLDTRGATPLEPRVLAQAVRQFGQAVRQRARRSDVVARLGEDEFAFLLFDTPPAGAETLARALHARFDQWAQQQGADARLTFSLIATPVEPVAIDQLIARARSAIQRAQKHPSSPSVVTAPSL